VALVTCREFPNLDEDDRLVLPELATRGITAVPVSWDDDAVDWDGFDLAVVRSTWDYVDRPGEFLAWAQSVPRLANPASVLRWNTDKRYLRDLAGAGVPVVPTTWLEPGDAVQLPATGSGVEPGGPQEGGHQAPMITGVETIVAKPSIGAGSRDAGRFDLTSPTDRELATKHIQRLLDHGETAMVQPYLEAVDTVGETALLFTGGEFSHAVRKAALLRGPDTDVEGLFREEEITARLPAIAERAVAKAALAAVAAIAPAELLYARVDLLPDDDGRPVLLELELSEPSLFLRTDARAASRFAAAIGTHLDRVLKTR
jgi:hypothetical protein